ncbi:hypothetical protein HK103_007365 [Boothiomyces macroporosus]|uniref:Uncharacterized protein n=1 Tax=Boothiomyces macroporosus TaxID=261099 RepID=A0AAD5UPA4_9FUNG|nr:hypothetical protein HK103_007365 [Boothiomyces macroporosus]
MPPPQSSKYQPPASPKQQRNSPKMSNSRPQSGSETSKKYRGYDSNPREQYYAQPAYVQQNQYPTYQQAMYEYRQPVYEQRYEQPTYPYPPQPVYQEPVYDTQNYAYYTVDNASIAPSTVPPSAYNTYAQPAAKPPSLNGSVDGLLKEKRYSSYDDDDDLGGERFCCGIFATKRGCVNTIGGITLFFLVGLGVGLFFLWPRMPSVTVENPLGNLGSDVGKLSFSSNDPANALSQASPQNPFIASIQLAVNIDVYSPNYIEYAFAGMHVQARLLDPSMNGTAVSKDPIGAGQIGRVAFPSFKNTTFTMPFNISFVAQAPVQSIEDNINLYTLARSCGAQTFGLQPGKIPNTIAIRIDGSIFSKVIDWTGFTPRFTRNIVIPCPESTQQLIQTLFNGIPNKP